MPDVSLTHAPSCEIPKAVRTVIIRYHNAVKRDFNDHPIQATPAILTRLRSLQASLSQSERAVAQVILERPEQIIRLSVEALAQAANVSTTTVMRLCHTLGFSGFRDFKLGLASDLGGRVAVLPERIEASDSFLTIAKKVFQADIEAIYQTLALLNEEVLAQVIHRLQRANRIEIYGVGSSAPVATDAYYRLLRLGMQVAVVTDSHMQAVSAGLLNETDVAFVISHTGRTTETLAAATHAKSRGATVICLTSFLRTPLIDLADLCLVTAAAETAFRVEAMASRIAHLSVIDAIYVMLAMSRFDDAIEVLDYTARIIAEKRI